MTAYKLDCGHMAFVTGDMGIGDSLMCPVEWQLHQITEDMSQPEPSPVINGKAPDRSYGCSYGCGNPYDYVIISVADGTTEFLCLLCYLKLAHDLAFAVANPDDPDVKTALAEFNAIERAPMTSGRVRSRGKNAPADIDDDDLIEAFDSRITAEELPEEMK